MTIAVLVAVGLVGAPGAVGSEGQVPDSLVFVRKGDLYRVTVDGSETVRMTTTPAWDELNPAVSPSALVVAYVRARRGTSASTIWTMTLDARNQTRVASRLGDDDPAWSPTGDDIYFARYSTNSVGDDCGSIFRVGTDGRGLRRVKRGSPNDFSPSVSIDGRVAFVESTGCWGSAFSLYLRVVDRSGRPTGDLRRLRRGPDYWEPRWSPDGTRLTFSSGLGSGGVFVANRDGSGLRRLTPKRMEAHGPVWSPSGEWISFSGSNGLWVVRPDGSALRHVRTTEPGDQSPDWLPRR